MNNASECNYFSWIPRAPPPLARKHARIARIATHGNANANTKHDFPAARVAKALIPPNHRYSTILRHSQQQSKIFSHCKPFLPPHALQQRKSFLPSSLKFLLPSNILSCRFVFWRRHVARDFPGSTVTHTVSTEVVRRSTQRSTHGQHDGQHTVNTRSTQRSTRRLSGQFLFANACDFGIGHTETNILILNI